MDIDKIKQLLDLIDGRDITELRVQKDGELISIKRGTVSSSSPFKVQHEEISDGKEEAAAKKEEQESHYVPVTSPIVGTLYRAPSPDAPYFVKVGSRVKKGQVLCIIEAMKLMNEIESEVDGIIEKAHVENGQSVEYGQTLFLISPLS